MSERQTTSAKDRRIEDNNAAMRSFESGEPDSPIRWASRSIPDTPQVWPSGSTSPSVCGSESRTRRLEDTGRLAPADRRTNRFGIYSIPVRIDHAQQRPQRGVVKQMRH